MVEEGRTGYLTRPEDVSAMTKALLRVTGDAQFRRSMGEFSFELFTRSFHASAMAERVEHVYLNTLQH
jgi:glycosyltransferase involved in cell wall biosynthesis